MNSPLLSLVIPSRNDNYMGNPNWRLQSTINFLAEGLTALDRLDDVEVVVVDWGSEIPLHNVLDLTEEGQRITRFILVPVSVHEAVRGESDFPDVIAVNTGIRRSRGDYICVTGNDILWSKGFTANLFAIFEGKRELSVPSYEAFMVFPRKHLPWDFVRKEPSIGQIQDFIFRYDGAIPAEPLNTFFLAPGGSFLMHRNLWFTSRSLDEKLIHWGANDMDVVVRMRLRYPALDMGWEAGLCVYHMQHYSFTGEKPLRRKKVNPVMFNPYTANSENWGLGDYRLKEFPSSKIGVNEDFSGPPPPPPLKDYRKRHLKNIMRLAFSNSYREGLDALVHFARDSTDNPLLSKILSLVRIPRFLKSQPLYERKIKGPWEE
jgi:hypothetical protein